MGTPRGWTLRIGSRHLPAGRSPGRAGDALRLRSSLSTRLGTGGHRGPCLAIGQRQGEMSLHQDGPPAHGVAAPGGACTRHGGPSLSLGRLPAGEGPGSPPRVGAGPTRELGLPGGAGAGVEATALSTNPEPLGLLPEHPDAETPHTMCTQAEEAALQPSELVYDLLSSGATWTLHGHHHSLAGGLGTPLV